MKLKISEHLSLPVDVVTQTIAVLAKRRAGKSYLMRRLVEQLFAAGQQVVLVDPKGDQWGVRSAADGKGPGLSVVILGGERGDVALEAGSGEIVAKLVVEERVSVVLDLSLFRKHEVATFMTGFLETLYRLKAREMYRTPLMLVMDEADAIAPQKPQKGEERMLGAAEDIVRRGGQRGIGCVLVTQRSAVLNKNLLTQAQVMIALRTIAPQDLAAMNAWIDVHGTIEQRQTLMESLPSLPIGDAWVWSPGWPTIEGIFKRVHVLPIETFDSGATPKPGETRSEPKSVADVDLESLKRQMAATIEKSKANDPKVLRARIAELERAAKGPAIDPGALDLVRREGRDEGAREGYAAGLRAVQPIADRLGTLSTAVSETIEGFQQDLRRLAGAVLAPQGSHNTAPARPARDPYRSPGSRGGKAQGAPKPRHNGNSGSSEVSRPQQRILNALAWMESVRISVVDKTQLALLADQSPTSGGYFNNLGTLRSAGLINYPMPSKVALTDAGRSISETVDTPSTSAALQDQVMSRLPRPQVAILRKLIHIYPREISKADLADAAEQSPTSGGYFNNLGRLRTLGLIDYPTPGKVAAQPVLFLE